MKNWRTTLSAVAAVIPNILHLVWPELFTMEITTALTTLFVAVGLTQAKDFNKTGTPEKK